jgi:hypothetical protein
MADQATCPHPPSRLYAGWARDEYLKLVLWVGCCQCGEVLQGGAGLPDRPEESAPSGA